MMMTLTEGGCAQTLPAVVECDFFITTRIRKMTEGNEGCSLLFSSHPGVTPSPFHNTSIGPMSLLVGGVGFQSPTHKTSTGHMSFPGGTPVPDGGTLVPGRGYPSPR